MSVKFTLPNGRKSWDHAASVVKLIRATSLNIQVERDVLIVNARGDSDSTGVATVEVPVKDVAIKGSNRFAISCFTFESVIGRRVQPITFTCDTDEGTMSFNSDNKYSGKDVPLFPVDDELPEDSYERPYLDKPTFPMSEQRKIIAAMKLAAVRDSDTERLDIQVKGDGNLLMVGSVMNTQSVLSRIRADTDTEFSIDSNVLSVISTFERVPFSIEARTSEIHLRTANVTLTLPVIAAGTETSLERIRPLITSKDYEYVTELEVEHMAAALKDLSFTFSETTPAMFTCTPTSVHISVDSFLGKVDATVDATGEPLKGDSDKFTFGLRGGDLMQLLHHTKGTVKLSCMSRGVRISCVDEDVRKDIFVSFYS